MRRSACDRNDERRVIGATALAYRVSVAGVLERESQRSPLLSSAVRRPAASGHCLAGHYGTVRWQVSGDGWGT
jgi:hypothetical protein